MWQIKRSSDGGVSSEQFGFATDIATRGDFDGDGLNDLAVYRPSTGVWYIKNSTNTGFIITRFGLAEDKPLPLDVDGDGGMTSRCSAERRKLVLAEKLRRTVRCGAFRTQR
jgi:hypothetical protein